MRSALALSALLAASGGCAHVECEPPATASEQQLTNPQSPEEKDIEALTKHIREQCGDFQIINRWCGDDYCGTAVNNVPQNIIFDVVGCIMDIISSMDDNMNIRCGAVTIHRPTYDTQEGRNLLVQCRKPELPNRKSNNRR